MNPKKKRKFDLFVSLTRKQSKEEIENKEKELGRELSRAEKHNIIRKNEVDLKRKFLGISILTLGLAFGTVGGVKLLNAGKETPKEIVESEVELNKENIKLENTPRKEFVDSLSVSKEPLEQVANIYRETEDEIDKLETSEQTLEYIKAIYLDEYNKINNANITLDHIKLYKTRTENMYLDQAMNGDAVYKITHDQEKSYNMQSEIGIIKVMVSDETGKLIKQEKVTKDRNTGEYITVYTENENAFTGDVGAIKEVGDIISNGIDLYAAQKEEEDKQIENEKISTYKQRLEDSVKDYKEKKIDENIISKRNNVENDQKDR